MGDFKDIFAATGRKSFAPVLGVVTNSMEFQRIIALPRRVLDVENVDDVTPMFAKSGEMSYWPIQSAMLIEAAIADGLFAMVSVGGGKTLAALSLPTAMDSKKAVYLVKTDLKKQLHREAETFYGKHFDLPLDRITVVSYRELSDANTATILEDLEPDLIIADEAHCLRYKESARTKRFLRYAKEHPACRYAFLSGTMTDRSINDYCHLIELALRKNSPLPRGYREIKDWAGALDVKPEYQMGPGILRKLCDEGENVRSGFRRRLVETQGVVATKEGALGTSLIVRKLTMPIPFEVKQLIRQLNKTWALGDEEFTTAMETARAHRQLQCGFYYQWEWPGGEPDHEWLEARRAWSCEVRHKLKYATEGMDSPMLLAQAAERYFQWDQDGRPRPRPAEKMWDSMYWPTWRMLRNLPTPPTKAHWQDDFVVDAAIAWAKKQTAPAIIWYRWSTVGERIASKGKFPLYNAGTDATESRDDVIVASMAVQGTGKNLQHHFSRNLLVSIPPNGTAFEQITGRTHRPGQLADEVVVNWFGHTPQLEDAMARVIEDAEYKEATTGQRQKILYATRINN